MNWTWEYQPLNDTYVVNKDHFRYCVVKDDDNKHLLVTLNTNTMQLHTISNDIETLKDAMLMTEVIHEYQMAMCVKEPVSAKPSIVPIYEIGDTLNTFYNQRGSWHGVAIELCKVYNITKKESKAKNE